MNKAKNAVKDRHTTLKALWLHRSTPLLKYQLGHAVLLYEKALKPSNIDPLTGPFAEDLNSTHDQIKKHWDKVYGGMESWAQLIHDMYLFQRFLVDDLLQDYAKQPYTVNEWVKAQADLVKEHTGLVNKVEQDYQKHVAYPLEELMLKRAHVESKLSGAAAGRVHIQGLIDRCEWSNLALALADDDTLTEFLSDDVVLEKVLGADQRKNILRGIDNIKNAYFTTFEGPVEFTLSPRAKEASLRRG